MRLSVPILSLPIQELEGCGEALEEYARWGGEDAVYDVRMAFRSVCGEEGVDGFFALEGGDARGVVGGVGCVGVGVAEGDFEDYGVVDGVDVCCGTFGEEV